MSIEGGCHCGAVRYAITGGDPVYHAVCHCGDCRKSSGAPLVSWALLGEDQVAITGETQRYQSSANASRAFCPRCGTGLFYTNAAMFPGMIDVQSATLDEPDTWPMGVQVQAAERIGWVEHLADVPAFDRYPAGEPEAD